MAYRLQSGPGNAEIALRRIRCLLDEGMEDDHVLADGEAVERAQSLSAHVVEVRIAHPPSTRVGHRQIGSELDKKFDEPCVVSQHINGPLLSLLLDLTVEVFDRERHDAKLAYMRTWASQARRSSPAIIATILSVTIFRSASIFPSSRRGLKT